MSHEYMNHGIEAESPYESYSHGELIDAFYDSEGDPQIGRELGVRLFRHAGFTDDPATLPLVGRNGNPVQEDGNTLTLADYVNFAAKRHFEALEGILSFLEMEPGTQDYEKVRGTIAHRLQANGN